ASLGLLVLLGGWRRVVQVRRAVPLWRLLFLALTGFVLFTAAFNYALLYGSASQGALVYATSPAVIAVCGALVLKERLRLKSGLGIALSIGGAAVIVIGGGGPLESAPTPVLGAVLMFLGVLLWGAYTVVAKQLAHLDQIALMFVVSVLSALLL